jgi:hypothetical protein
MTARFAEACTGRRAQPAPSKTSAYMIAPRVVLLMKKYGSIGYQYAPLTLNASKYRLNSSKITTKFSALKQASLLWSLARLNENLTSALSEANLTGLG